MRSKVALPYVLILHCLAASVPTAAEGTRAGEFLHYEDDLHGPYELKAPPHPQYETFTLPGHGLVDQLEVGLVLPDDFNSTKSHPVMLFFGGGPQQRFNWEDWCARFFDVSRALGFARDWVLIAPIAPQGMMFHTELAEEMPRLFDAVRKRYVVEGGRFHLVGQSNGGNSAFKIALRNPEEFVSLTVHTGMPSSLHPDVLSRLHPLHIFMYWGDMDCFGFNKGMKAAAQAIQASGQPPERFDFLEFPGVGHFGILDALTTQPRLNNFWRSLESLRSGSSAPSISLLPPPPQWQASGQTAQEL